MMPDDVNCYTAITFAPVQGFIEKSRKLRDLYGSSFILSYLADALCQGAREYAGQRGRALPRKIPGYPVISPALIDVTQGTPNQIIIEGEFPKTEAEETFAKAWSAITQACQQWFQDPDRQALAQFDYCWRREWSLWTSHTWECFWAKGATIAEAREGLNEVKRSRDWIGVNWTGESSTLSGADAIAYPGMGRKVNPKARNLSAEVDEIRAFYQELSQQLGNLIDAREQLSLPELIKRLITVNQIAEHAAALAKVEIPPSFKDLNRWQDEDIPGEVDRQDAKRWTGWFQGDGDRAGEYLKAMSTRPDTDEVMVLHTFSDAMRRWGKDLWKHLPNSPKTRKTLDRDGRIIYAGGDDFLGVLYRNPPDQSLKAHECLDWFYRFKPDVWSHHGQPITVSVGFVWAAPNIPQREVLQHCREAEQGAKKQGRDRLALRVLFNSGNYLEWVCPWRFLPVLQDYGDRERRQNWAHLFNDVAALEARHAFQGKDAKGKPVDDGLEIALALFNVYFKADHTSQDPRSAWNHSDKDVFYNLMRIAEQTCNQAAYWEQDGLWNVYDGASQYDPKAGERLHTGILGDHADYTADKKTSGTLDHSKAKQALTTWIINLAKVGFHLCSDI